MDLQDWPVSPENWVHEGSLEAAVSTVCPDPRGSQEPRECPAKRETRDQLDPLEGPAWPGTRDRLDPRDPSDRLDLQARKDQEGNLDYLDCQERTDCLETTGTPANLELKETRVQRDIRVRWVSLDPVELREIRENGDYRETRATRER